LHGYNNTHITEEEEEEEKKEQL